MTPGHIDGHMIAALFLCPIAATWIVGFINTRLAAKARKRARVTHVGQWDRWQ